MFLLVRVICLTYIYSFINLNLVPVSQAENPFTALELGLIKLTYIVKPKILKHVKLPKYPYTLKITITLK